MDKSFVYGVSVSGENFTDRVNETKHIRMNFENGLNTILISPRRLGKTSLIDKVRQELADNKEIVTVYIDIYDCRNEYDFYNKFASSILSATSSKLEQALDRAKEFLGRIAPKISVSPDLNNEYSISLGLRPKENSPESILSLPENIAQKNGVHIVVCIDEFQQIGEFPDSLYVQKRLRGVWQHQKNVSYCLYGSKKHMMEKLFKSKRMPFYQFGDVIYLATIPTEDWVPFIVGRFETKGMAISKELAAEICHVVENHSSYVQQLAWNVMLETDKQVTKQNLESAIAKLIIQNAPLYIQQTENLSSYQMNFLKAVCAGVHTGFTQQSVLQEYNLGTKSNIYRLKKSLTEKELVHSESDGVYISDPVFKLWFSSEFAMH